MNIQDTFQRANNSNINTNAPFAWAIQESSLADFSISNNQLALPITASIHSLRAEVDLTQNHYCEVTVVTSNADDSGAICRFDSAGANYYAYDWTAGQQKWRVVKVIATATTVRAASAVDPPAGNQLFRLAVIDSNLTASRNGSVQFSLTDTSIANNRRTGILANPSAAAIKFSLFTAGFLGTTPSNTNVFDVPQGPQPLPPPRDFSNILATLLAPPNLQKPFTNYYPPPIGPQPLPAPRDYPNLLATTLIPATASRPFSRIWPPPPGPQPLPLPPRDYQNLLLSTLAQPQQRQYDWPVPKGPAPLPLPNPQFGENVNNTLLLSLPLPVGRLLDWPVPQGPQQLPQPIAPVRDFTNLFASTLTQPPGGDPFSQSGWPDLRPPVPPPAPHIQQNLLGGPLGFAMGGFLPQANFISDPFTRLDSSNFNVGSPFAWTAAEGNFADCAISSNQLALPQTGIAGGHDTHSLRAMVNIAPDHFAAVTVLTANADDVGVLPRFAVASATYYAFDWSQGQLRDRLLRVVGGVVTILAQAPQSTNPGSLVFRIEAIGSTIRGLRNGALELSVKDTVIPNNTLVGIISNPVAGNERFDSFSAGIIVPFSQDDWPVPKGPAPLPQPLDFRSQLPGLLTEPIPQPFNLDDWPVPRGPDIQPLPQPQLFNAGGSPLVLTPPSETPFNQEDWPTPESSVRPPMPQPPAFINQQFAALGQTPPPGAPFAQYDWPVPKGPAPLPLPNPQYGENINNTLIFFPIMPNGRLLDWPVPKGPAPLPDPPQITNARINLPTTNTKPFAQFDWPVPKGPAPLVVQKDFANLSPTLFTPNLRPFNQYDWPLPGRPPFPAFLLNNKPTPPTFYQPSPFNQDDWPLPGRPPFPQHVLNFAYNTPLCQIIPKQAPFLRVVYPAPRGPQPLPLPPQTINPAETALGRTTIINPPHRQYDWPVPRGSQPLPDPPQFNNLLPHLLPPPITTPPPRQRDSPVPPGPQPLPPPPAFINAMQSALGLTAAPG